MIDVLPHRSRMQLAGREGRALLRSNSSARTGAGTGAGACLHGRLSSPLACSDLKAKNLGGLGAKPPAVHRTDRCAIWQDLRGLDLVVRRGPRACASDFLGAISLTSATEAPRRLLRSTANRLNELWRQSAVLRWNMRWLCR